MQIDNPYTYPFDDIAPMIVGGDEVDPALKYTTNTRPEFRNECEASLVAPVCCSL